MHSHVVKCMTVELPDVLDEWAAVEQTGGGGREPRRVGTITPHYVGGRDWVVTIIHPDHALLRASVEHGEPIEHGHSVGRSNRLAKFGDDSREALASVGGIEINGTLEGYALGEAVGGIRMQRATLPNIADDGSILPASHGVQIEDAARTWIMWTNPDGRPAVMWLKRDEDGGIIEPGIRFDEPEHGMIRLTTEPGDDYPEPGPNRDDQQAYINWLANERSWFWNACVSARETLRVAGWPDAEDSTEPLHKGIAWLAERAKDAERRAAEAEGAAGAYTDAVVALQEVRGGAPLSTTLGWLIRQGYLISRDPKAAKPIYPVTTGTGVHAPHQSVFIDRIDPQGTRERIAELAPIGAAGDKIEPLVDYTREVIAAIGEATV